VMYTLLAALQSFSKNVYWLHKQNPHYQPLNVFQNWLFLMFANFPYLLLTVIYDFFRHEVLMFQIVVRLFIQCMLVAVCCVLRGHAIWIF